MGWPAHPTGRKGSHRRSGEVGYPVEAGRRKLRGNSRKEKKGEETCSQDVYPRRPLWDVRVCGQDNGGR